MSVHTLVAIWGAVLSSILGLIKVWETWRNIPRLRMSAALTHEASGDYGTQVESKHGTGYAYIRVDLTNVGEKPVQAFCIVVSGLRYTQQITTQHLPMILQPGARVTTRLQKEWLDDPSAIGLGVMSGSGKQTLLSNKDFAELAIQSRALPSNRKQYKKNDDPEAPPVWAFKVRDVSVFTENDTRRVSLG